MCVSDEFHLNACFELCVPLILTISFHFDARGNVKTNKWTASHLWNGYSNIGGEAIIVTALLAIILLRLALTAPQLRVLSYS